MTTTLSEVAPVEGLGNGSVTPQLLNSVGYKGAESTSALSVMVDHHFDEIVSVDDRVVVMPLQDAVVTYPWIQELMFSLVEPSSDEVLRRAFESTLRPLGTFTWVKPGAVLDKPLQSYSVMTVPQERQFVHDVTVIGEGAVVSSLSGSVVTPRVTHGHHVSLSETFVGKNARLRSMSIDRWGRKMDVRSYSGSRLDEGASSTAVSIAVSPVRRSISNARTEVCAHAVDATHDVVLAPEGTYRESNSTITLLGDGARAEQVARMVSDGGCIANSTTLVGEGRDCSGFLECDGLMLTSEGYIDSVPALKARTDNARLSHEASVGMVDQDRLDYLMASGLDEDGARDLIVRGFLELDDQQIPADLRQMVADLVSAARNAEM